MQKRKTNTVDERSPYVLPLPRSFERANRLIMYPLRDPRRQEMRLPEFLFVPCTRTRVHARVGTCKYVQANERA